jgi:hypothetical protein
VEYWGGGRSAALVHTAADGTTDLAIPANVRVYFFAGNQHGPGAFPPAAGAGQQKGNPTDYWWNMRALFVAMDKWVRGAARRSPHCTCPTGRSQLPTSRSRAAGVQAPERPLSRRKPVRHGRRGRERRCRSLCLGWT